MGGRCGLTRAVAGCEGMPVPDEVPGASGTGRQGNSRDSGATLWPKKGRIAGTVGLMWSTGTPYFLSNSCELHHSLHGDQREPTADCSVLFGFLFYVSDSKDSDLLFCMTICYPIRVLFKGSVVTRIIFLVFVRRIYFRIAWQIINDSIDLTPYFLCAGIGVFKDLIVDFLEPL